MRTKIKSMIALFALTIPVASLVNADEKVTERHGRTLWVNCDDGQSLKKAVERKARRGTIIYIRGTCNERITIKKDWLTIKASGVAAVDGAGVKPGEPEFNAMITIDGARSVTLSGFAVENSSAEGIIVKRNASVTLREMTISNNANLGVLVDSARVDFEDSSATGNLSGIDSLNNSTIVFRGQVDLTQNFVFGLGASNGTAVELRGADLNLSHNGQLGTILEGAHMAIFNFGVSVGSSITADYNGGAGLVLVGGGRLDIIAIPPFHDTGVNQVSASNNGDSGFWLANVGSIESPFGTATFLIENNRVGIRAEAGSDLLIVGGALIRNNSEVGLLADAAGVLTLVSSEGDPSPNPSEILGNGTDVSMTFGSRATFGAAIGTIFCDDTVLVRGSIACP